MKITIEGGTNNTRQALTVMIIRCLKEYSPQCRYLLWDSRLVGALPPTHGDRYDYTIIVKNE